VAIWVKSAKRLDGQEAGKDCLPPQQLDRFMKVTQPLVEAELSSLPRQQLQRSSIMALAHGLAETCRSVWACQNHRFAAASITPELTKPDGAQANRYFLANPKALQPGSGVNFAIFQS
jgi:hypothetical protein